MHEFIDKTNLLQFMLILSEGFSCIVYFTEADDAYSFEKTNHCGRSTR